jgi:hypothetical protein
MPSNEEFYEILKSVIEDWVDGYQPKESETLFRRSLEALAEFEELNPGHKRKQ